MYYTHWKTCSHSAPRCLHCTVYIVNSWPIYLVADSQNEKRHIDLSHILHTENLSEWVCLCVCLTMAKHSSHYNTSNVCVATNSSFFIFNVSVYTSKSIVIGENVTASRIKLCEALMYRIQAYFQSTRTATEKSPVFSLSFSFSVYIAVPFIFVSALYIMFNCWRHWHFFLA